MSNLDAGSGAGGQHNFRYWKDGDPLPPALGTAEHAEKVDALNLTAEAVAGLRGIGAMGYRGNAGWLVEQGLACDWPPMEPEKVRQPVQQGLPTREQAERDARAAAEARRPRPRLLTTDVADVEAEDVEWLWPGRFPKGRVSVVMGRQGKGKSTLVSWIASTVANGTPWPDCPDDNEPGTVLILQAEESIAQDLRPRLDAFGLARGRIHVIRGVDRGDGVESSFNLSADAEALRAEVERRGDVRLVIVDPVGSYIRGISGYNEAEVRVYLTPLFALAEECDVAVILVMHPKKDTECDVLDRASGSGAFTQMARMSWYFSEDPNDSSRRLLSLMKGNLHGATRTAIAVHYDDKRKQITWFPDPVNLEAQQVDNLLQKQAREAKLKTKPGRDPEKARKAEEFLLKLLECGPCSLSAAKEKALLLGISFSTLRRVMNDLTSEARKVVEKYPVGPDERTWFRLAAQPAEGGENGPEGRAPNSPETPPPPG